MTRVHKSLRSDREARAAMIDAQRGLCAVCGEPPKNTKRRRETLVLDHCHVTGQPRAMLCVSCNTGLGMFKDNALLLAKAYAYVTAHDLRVAAIVAEASLIPPPAAPTPQGGRINDGGWATRRRRYGASGLKRRSVKPISADANLARS